MSTSGGGKAAPEARTRLRGRLVAHGPRLGLLLLAAGGVLLCFGGTPLWWLGASMVTVVLTLTAATEAPALAALASWLRRPRSVGVSTVRVDRLLWDVGYCLALIAIGSVMMWEIVGGERPVSHDHTVHYFKAWQLHEHFLKEGRLFGWSQRWFAGYPVNYLYPIGADLWVNAVHALSLGALSFSAAYGAAFWLFHLFTGLAGYRLGRLIGGPHVGAICGLLMLTDQGEFRMGGWAYTVEYGVWPQALSLNLALMALCSVPAIASERRLAPLAAFGVWMGLAIITHPVQLIFLALLLLVTAFAAAFAERAHALSAVFRLAMASALSMGVASVWLIPFLSVRAETNVMGVWWDTTYELGKGLLTLEALPGTPGWVLAFAVPGLLLSLRTRAFDLLFYSLLALFIPALCNSTFIDEFHLPFVSGSFTKVQFLRMSTMAKPFYFALAAYFAVAVVRYSRHMVLRPRPERSTPSPLLRAALAAVISLLTLPVLVPAVQSYWARYVKRSLVTLEDRPLLEDRRQLQQWLQKNLPRDRFYRLGVFTGHNHHLLDLGAILDQPIYKRGFTPCSNFVYKMRERDPAILRAVNLRFAISKMHLPTEEFELVERFGTYRLYRFLNYNPEPFQILEGDGDIKLERFSDEEVAFVVGPGAHGRVRLNVSYFSRWHAYRDGEEIPIAITYLREAPEDTGFMTVDLAPGRYRFRFERTLLDRLSLPISIAFLLLSLSLVLGERRGVLPLRRAMERSTRVFDALGGIRFARLRASLLGLLVVALLGIGVALALWTPVIESDELRLDVRRVRYDFLERLSAAHAIIEYKNGFQTCYRQGERHICRDEEGNLDDTNFIASTPGEIKEYTMVRCIRMRPVDKALLSLTYDRAKIGERLIGYYGVERAGRLMRLRRPVEFRVLVDGRVVYEGHTESDNKMHYFDIPLKRFGRRRNAVSFSVRADNVRKRYFCFNAQMVDLQR
ncbi:MAG: hypothetical protein OEZ06_14000 [Myxococcales bacterium]|nr:hypothetical protein [Myxococcales bacterium]